MPVVCDYIKLFRQQLIRQPLKLINKLRIIIPRSRPAKPGMDLPHIATFVNDNGRRETLKTPLFVVSNYEQLCL